MKKSYLSVTARAAPIPCSVCLPGVCSDVKVQLPDREKRLKNGFGVWFVLLGISTGWWGSLGSLSGLCASAEGPPNVGGMRGGCAWRGWGASRGSRSFSNPRSQTEPERCECNADTSPHTQRSCKPRLTRHLLLL